jgi:hypothetical protein
VNNARTPNRYLQYVDSGQTVKSSDGQPRLPEDFLNVFSQEITTTLIDGVSAPIDDVRPSIDDVIDALAKSPNSPRFVQRLLFWP